MAPKLSGYSSSLCLQSQLPSDTWPAQSWSCQTSEQKLPVSPYLHCTLPYSHPHCCHKICLLAPPGMLNNALFSYLLTNKSCWDLRKNLPKCALVRISCSGSYAKTFAATNSIKEKNKLGSIPPLPFLSRGCENERARFTGAWKRKVYQVSNILLWVTWKDEVW